MFSILLVLAMVLSMMPAAVFAADTVATVGSTGYATLQDAVDAASASGGTVTVTADIDLEATIEITTGTLTVDLAGKAVKYVGGNAFHVTGGNLTIEDSSAEKTGYLYGNGSEIDYTALCVDGGSVTINGGTFGGYMYSILANGGTVVVNDIVAEDDIRNVGGSITINGGIMGHPTSYSGGQIDASGGATVINGGTFETKGSSYMFYLNGGTVEVNGGRFTFLQNFCIRFNTGDSDIVLKGGTFVNSLKVSASYASGLDVYLSDLIPYGYYVYDDTGTEVDLGYDTKTLKGYYVIAQTSPGARVYNVTYNLTNLVSSNTSTTLPKGHSLFATFTGISPEYAAPEYISIKMNGSYFSTSKYSYSDGNLMIMSSNITGDIVITATAVESWNYTVEGSPAIVGSNNAMTGSGTVYTKTYTNVPVGTGYELSVKGTSPSSTTQSATVVFDVIAACDVTVTYDTSTGDITVTGDGVAVQGPADIILYYDNTTTQWSKVYIYAWNDDGDVTAAWPGDMMTLVDGETNIYYAQLPGEATYVIYNNGSGTQSGDMTIAGVDGNMYNHSAGSWSTYDSDIVVCTHETHGTNGYCNSCGRYVGHTYVNGTCSCGATEPVSTDRVIYLQNDAGWSVVYAYTWTTANGSTTNYHGSWPGSKMTAVSGANNLYSITVPSDAVNIIFHNNSGTQTDDLTLSADKNLYNNSTKTWSSYEVSCNHNYVGSVTTAATCTTAGVKTYTCSACGDSYTEAIPSTGHTEAIDAAVAATCTSTGLTEGKHCSVCNTVLVAQTVVNTIAHNYTNGSCTICGAADPDYSVTAPTVELLMPTLSFEDEVFYNAIFSVTNPDNVEIVEMGLLTWFTATDGDITNAEFITPGAAPYGTNYIGRSQGIAPKDMNKNLYFKAYIKLADGSYVYSSLKYYSAKMYVTNKLSSASTTDDLKALCVALMNYGAAAQTYFNVEGTLMNADLTDYQSLVSPYSDSMLANVVNPDAAKVSGLALTSDAFSKRYPAVEFGGAFSIAYSFLPAKTVDNGMKLYIWDAATYESVDTLTLANASSVVDMEADASGMYVGSVTGIAAKDVDETVYVCGVYESNGEICYTGVLAYSLGTYCKSKASGTTAIQPLAAATAVYSYYAKLYLSNN